MTHRMTLLLTIVALLGTSAVARQEPPADKKGEPQKEAGYDNGERIFNKIDVEVQIDDGWVKAERIGKPLLLYGDPTRNHEAPVRSHRRGPRSGVLLLLALLVLLRLLRLLGHRAYLLR